MSVPHHVPHPHSDAPATPAIERHYRPLLLLLCLSSAALLALLSWHSIADFRFWDPDDVMRLMEVRDWLGGQSWFDVSQHRMNLPSGLSMHWSRLLDLPLAGVILLFEPFTGARVAETVAAATVPLVTFGATMMLVAAITRHRSGSGPALLAAVFCLLSVGAWYAMLPMRIDHHGDQIVCGLAMVWVLAARRDHRRGAALAGLCAALWTHISLEGLAFTVCVSCWLGLLGIADADRRPLLPAFLGTLTAASVALYLAVHGLSSIGRTYCDQISPVHLGIFTLSAVLGLASVALPGRSMIVRLAALVTTALACAVLYRVWAPQCMAGPFGALGPLGRGLWYMNVHEGRPLWEAPLETRLSWGIFPWVGLIGGILTTMNARERDLAHWTYCALLAGAIAIGLMVTRAGAFANLLAIPGAVGLVPLLIRRTEHWPVSIRVLPRAAAIILLSPLVAQSTPLLNPAPHDARPARAADGHCGDIDGMASLNLLPPAIVLAPLELGPTILAGSHDAAVSGPYHRNPDALEDVLRFFTTTPDKARAIAARRHAGLVLFCPAGGEMTSMANVAPRGLAAHLEQGRPPVWLKPVKLPGGSHLAVYRIDPD